MRLVLTRGAARQLDAILDYIEDRNPAASLEIQRRIQMMMDLLLQYPELGQTTNRPFVRRLIVNPYPYVIYYRVIEDQVVVQRIRHAAQRPV